MTGDKLKDLGGCIEFPNCHSPEPPTPQPRVTTTTCARCKDVHVAQRSGLTIHPCGCDCHIIVSSSTIANQVTIRYEIKIGEQK
jgi:hypothetical protein